MGIASLMMLCLGLVLMVAGAEALVRGASKLASMLGIPPLIVGLTVVAYGTSSPEMAVSLQSTFADHEAISIGNIVGSNIFNVLFILGISASITPLLVAQQLVKLDVPIMIGTSLLLMVLSFDHKIDQLDGALLFSGALMYTCFLLVQNIQTPTPPSPATADLPSLETNLLETNPRESNPPVGFMPPAPRVEPSQIVASQVSVQSSSRSQVPQSQPQTANHWNWGAHVGLIVLGVLLLTTGSRLLVTEAVAIAEWIGLSQLVIGLTLVSLGTSLPEVATSVVASLKGERDIAVGNVVGSNIFNILAVLGVAGLLSPDGVDVSAAALNFDIPVMTGVAIACLPIFFAGNIITRWEGTLFLGYYAAYTTYLILNALNHGSLPVFSRVVILFVIPLAIVTLVTIMFRNSKRL